MHRARQRLGRFFRGDADGFAGAQVDEGRGHLSPVAKFQGALSETASGDDGDGVGGAAVDFDERDQTLAIFSARVFDAQLLESSMARRTPSTCPAQRWPWACSAWRRYSSKVMTFEL